MTEYKAIEKWTRPDSFMAFTHGAPYNGEWYVFLGQHRESSILDQVNFITGLRELGGTSDTVMVVQESCSLVGWIQWIAIHESDTESLEKADDMLCAIADYPVLDEMAYSEHQTDEMYQYWEKLSLRDRMEWASDGYCSAMEIRHDCPPELVLDAMHDMECFK